MPDTPHIVSDVMTFPVVAVRRDARFDDEEVRRTARWNGPLSSKRPGRDRPGSPTGPLR